MAIFGKYKKQTHKINETGRRDVRRQNIFQLVAGIAIIVALNAFGAVWFARFDLTSEKRFTLTHGTRNMLRQLDDIVYFRVYLEGDFPAGFKRLSNQTREILDEFRAFSDKIQYEFINPVQGQGSQGMVDMLIQKGLQPTRLQVRADDATSQQIIFPGALVTYRGKEIALQLLQDQIGKPAEEVLNNSAQALEYNLATAIRQLTTTQKEKVALLEGQGELNPRHLADLAASLGNFYLVERISIDNNIDEILGFRTLIVAKPEKPFTEPQKFIIDQYIMHGGSVLWLIDPVFASMDSLKPPAFQSIGMPWPINLDDMLFRYGVRLNPNLLMDLRAAPIPVTTGMIGNRPQINLLPWFFFPLAEPSYNHKITRNLNLIRTEFASSIDTVTAPGVEKTILLSTSPYTRVVATPAEIALRILQQQPDERQFSAGQQNIAVLLEGTFESVFRNRMAPEVKLPAGFRRLEQSLHTAMIVVADGDIARNQTGADGQPLPLGFDRFSNSTFANRDFILNAVNYLSDDSGILEARAKDMRLRMLDRTRLNRSRNHIQIVNIIVPVLIVIVFGSIRLLWRKRLYSAK